MTLAVNGICGKSREDPGAIVLSSGPAVVGLQIKPVAPCLVSGPNLTVAVQVPRRCVNYPTRVMYIHLS